MIDLNDIIRQLTANAQAVQALLETVSYDQAVWKPDAETWSLAQTMDHLYNEERGDFRAHIQEILSQPQVAWGAMQPPWSQITSLKQGLTDFLREREDSITWLRGLAGANWETALTASFGPDNEQVTLRAGDVLVSWVAHDHLHLRQFNELLFAYNQRQARPYSVDYAGGW